MKRILLVIALLFAAPASASANQACLDALDDLGVQYERTERKLIKTAVLVVGDLGGVEFRSYSKQPLVLDCSAVYSLVQAARFLRGAGVVAVTYSSAYQIRNIHGTKRRSKHSYGLAIDMHTFHTDDLGELSVTDHYEQGLGDNIDCIGDPITSEGTILKQLDCQFNRSQLFRIILTPDYDAGHYNHFHVEALPWAARTDVR